MTKVLYFFKRNFRKKTNLMSTYVYVYRAFITGSFLQPKQSWVMSQRVSVCIRVLAEAVVSDQQRQSNVHMKQLHVRPLTSIRWIQWVEQHSKERCGIFASIDNVWKCQSSVTVAAQTLCKTKPRRQAWDQRTHTIRNTATQWRPYTEHLSLIHIWRCRRIERCRSRWSPYH